MSNVTDPFNLYETLYWCFVAGQANRKATAMEREGIVKDALDRLYKKLEGKKIIIQVLPDEKELIVYED